MSAGAASVRWSRSARSVDDEQLDAFAARAAHALGTGVSIAAGYAELLRERFAEPLGDEGAATLAGLEGGIDRMRLFVGDLLELARIDGAPLLRQPLSAAEVADVAARAVGAVASAVDDAQVEVEVGEMPEVLADPAMLEQLLRHLVRGAFAAVAPGPGRISVSGVRRAAGARIVVSDTGEPIVPPQGRTLFEPFAAPRGTGAIVGAGVSMVICRRIAERHGGSIWAHSGRRDGCTIVVLLPERG
jgi:signal transduction histidine kinase